MQETFADVLGHYIQHSQRTTRQVATLSGLPHRTIANWMGGISRKPQQWQGIVKVAVALKLNEAEASRLLEAASHPPVTELRQTITGNDLELLVLWPPPAHAPFQAVADLPYFVGREAAMRELEGVLGHGRHVAICNLHGMGGVGKTSLAAHLAYRLRAQFPDGVLWARPDTTDTMTILSAFADAYGKDVSGYRDVESRATIVRNLLADKRILVVLDNVESSEQVRPLLPPTTGKTAVLITTRHDLAVADQMHRFPVESFDPAIGEALALFSHFLGQSAVQQWLNELQAIADLLGHLPLAIAIAAGQLAYGRVPIPHLLTQLQQSDQRLDTLVREDRSVRLSFDLSYRALSSEMQRFFAALGAFGGDGFGVTAVAYVTHTTPTQAQNILDQLHHLSLVQMGTAGRYQLHPLLRDYARENITSENSYTDMATFYIDLAESIKDGDYRPLIPETSIILACLKILQERQLHTHLLRALKAFNPYLHAQGLNELQEFYLEQAKASAYLLEEPEVLVELLLDQLRAEFQRGRLVKVPSLLSEALALIETSNLMEKRNLQLKCDLLTAYGIFHKNSNDPLKAQERYAEAVEIAYDIGYMDAVAKIKISQGLLFIRVDDDQTITYHLEALPLARQHSSYHVIITCLLNLCELYLVQEKFEQAEIYLDEAEELAKRHGHQMHLIAVFMNRGQIANKKGDVASNEFFFNESARIARETDHWSGLVPALLALSNRARLRGDFNKAQELLDETLAISSKQNSISNRLSVFLNWGELYRSQGRLDESAKVWVEVLEKAHEINSPRHLIHAYYGLARTAKAQGKDKLSRQYTQSWQSLYEQMNQYEKMWMKHWLPELPV